MIDVYRLDTRSGAKVAVTRPFELNARASPDLTRYYLEIPRTDAVGDWPDERIWAELARRLHVTGEPAPVPSPLIEILEWVSARRVTQPEGESGARNLGTPRPFGVPVARAEASFSCSRQ